MDLRNDIYYNREFSKLYLKEGYSLFEFNYQKGDEFLINISIKKPITRISGEEVSGYFDLETPYGYGGFYTNSENPQFINEAYELYRSKCLQENIIAEFFSFHPYNDFPKKHPSLFDICFKDRDVVSVDLLNDKEQRWLDYKSKTRTILRKCERELVFQKSDSLDDFIKLYYHTMEKNGARDFYFFDQQYFDTLSSFENVELYSVMCNSEVVAMTFILFSGEIAHYHLSANNNQYLNKNANYYILDQAFDIAKERGCKYFMLGGGRTPSEEDSLYSFKSKFSSVRRDFYLAGNVYNKEIYDKYISIWEQQNIDKDVKYFLKYRL